jgi:sulfoxide reductase heme-binding subunit YedZ
VSSRQPLSVVWWLVSRASGTVALVLISLSVILGLAMAAKVLRRPASRRMAATLHEHVALVSLLAIAVHGLSLLGDRWLHPGWRGITVPFAMSYRPGLTGIGILAGYLAVVLGPSFYLRRRFGARRWRSLHRGIIAVWVMGAVHTLGAGTDGGRMWLRIIVLAPVAPIVYLLVVRLVLTATLPRSSRAAPPSDSQRHAARAPEGRPAARTADGHL